MKENEFTGYCLRYAAGTYWLLDIRQQGLSFVRPIRINAVGADIWKHLSEGKGEAQIAEILASEYEIEPSVAAEDITLFLAQLREKGVRR